MIDQTTIQTISVILQSTLVAVVIVAVILAWRWLKVALNRGELQAQNETLAQLTVYAKIFVNAAEQTLAKQPGFAKLDWVLDQFATVMPDVDRDLIRSVVEATVRSLPKDPPKTLTLAAPTFTGTPSSPPATATTTTPPAPANAPAVISYSHKQTKSKARTDG
jgi:hypothetical protein